MLDQTVTITICGKNYRLKTDNIEQITTAVNDLENKFSEYCSESLRFSKEDAAVFTALDFINELYDMKKDCKALAGEIERLKKGEEAAKSAIEKCRALEEENAKLKKSGSDFEKLTKRYSELEGNNEQLALSLKAANDKAAKSAALEKALAEAKKSSDDLGKKSEQLAVLVKDTQAKLDAANKTVFEKEKRISELERDQAKTAAVVEENKRLSEKLERAKNFEEAFQLAKKRAEAAEKERDHLKKNVADPDAEKKLKAELEAAVKSKQQSDKDLGDLTAAYDKLDKVNKELAAKNHELEEQNGINVLELEELKVKFSQIESENNALKQTDNTTELESIKAQLEEITIKNAELSQENQALKKTNASLDKQIREMLDDGQLTL